MNKKRPETTKIKITNFNQNAGTAHSVKIGNNDFYSVELLKELKGE